MYLNIDRLPMILDFEIQEVMRKDLIKQGIRYRGEIYKFIFHNDLLMDSMYFSTFYFILLVKLASNSEQGKQEHCDT